MGSKGNVCQRSQFRSPFKSPSDTTIYSPGLKKGIANNVLNMVRDHDDVDINNISNFVERIRINDRLDHSSGSCSRRSPVRASPLNDVTPVRGGDTRHVEHSSRKSQLSQSSGQRKVQQQHNPDDTDRVTEQLLVQAERFKARVEAPKGNSGNSEFVHRSGFNELLMPYDYDRLRSKFIRPEGSLGPIDNEILFLRNFDQDDEFFHITSQIDSALRVKIERGEFIDLERLLPKDKAFGGSGGDELNKQLFQLITQGTNSYLEPPVQHPNGKINSLRKWDQAFRVYAAIYTHANLGRSSKIWQYVYVIHTAATSNPWENVYYYDINFRELMATKPWRSWGKTYTQGWNMAFNNINSHYNQQNHSSQHSVGATSSGSYQKTKDWKDDCCWRYNKKQMQKIWCRL